VKWDLGDRTEDAVSSYLRRVVPDDMAVYAAWEADGKIQYPCAIVYGGPLTMLSEDAEYNDHRMIDVAVVVVTQLRVSNLLTIRQQHAHYTSEVMGALAISDLTTKVQESLTPAIAFSLVSLEETEAPVVENAGRRRISVMSLKVYCEPVTGS
jgi:hypothetical protein